MGIMGATERARSVGFAKDRDGKFVTVITHDYTQRQRAALSVDARGNRYMGDGLWITRSGERYRDPRY
jgi:hypothetical protein